MKILLTGATGNVGSHTLPELVGRGHEVRCLLRLSTANRCFAQQRGKGVEVRWGDVTDAEAVRGAAEGVEAVVHLAGVIPPTADDQPELARQVNVDGTANVVAACLAQPVPPSLLFSS